MGLQCWWRSRCWTGIFEKLKWAIPVPSSERFHHKPVISEDLKNTTVKEGDQVTLVCRVTSELHPHIVWIKHYQINGSYKDENGTAYYRRINSTQVLIPHATAIKIWSNWPCGLPPATYLSVHSQRNVCTSSFTECQRQFFLVFFFNWFPQCENKLVLWGHKVLLESTVRCLSIPASN